MDGCRLEITGRPYAMKAVGLFLFASAVRD